MYYSNAFTTKNKLKILFISLICIDVIVSSTIYADLTERSTGQDQLPAIKQNRESLDRCFWGYKYRGKGNPSDEKSVILFEQSRTYFQNKDYKQSIQLLKEIVNKYPESKLLPMVYLGMGEVYQKLDDEKNMLLSYRMAALMPPVDTRMGIMDASNTHNRASEILANHYFTKGQWSEALKFLMLWHPSSWCGTCSKMMRKRREKRIETCLENIRKIRGRTQYDMFFKKPWFGEFHLLTIFFLANIFILALAIVYPTMSGKNNFLYHRSRLPFNFNKFGY